jgi:flagellar protein FlaG
MIHHVAPKVDLSALSQRAHEPAEVVARHPREASTRADSGTARPDQSNPSEIDRDVIERAAAKVSKILDFTDPRLKIEVDDESERVVIKVVEQDSGKVIRQIPPEELLQLEKYLSSAKGLLLQEQA